MSNWVHVAGVIRIDNMFGIEKSIDFKEELGKVCLFHSPCYVWEEYNEHPERFLPCGSEGSLQFSVLENPNKSHLARYVVTIWGDLRDYEESDRIIEWFKEKCSKFHIRQACITVLDEYYGTKNWVYEYEK